MATLSPQDEETLARIERSLTNISPTPITVERIEQIRRVAKLLGQDIVTMVPNCRERSLALTHLEETAMWAVKALVLTQGENGG